MTFDLDLVPVTGKPFTFDEILQRKKKQVAVSIPPKVIDLINNLMVTKVSLKNTDDSETRSIKIYEAEIITILKMVADETGKATSTQPYPADWLSIETVYEPHGWKVVYYRDTVNQANYFTFTYTGS